MGDLDDMNATPLGKLPMPMVQSKADAPRVEMHAASYEDILKEMRTDQPPRATPQAFQPMPQAQPRHDYPSQMHAHGHAPHGHGPHGHGHDHAHAHSHAHGHGHAHGHHGHAQQYAMDPTQMMSPQQQQHMMQMREMQMRDMQRRHVARHQAAARAAEQKRLSSPAAAELSGPWKLVHQHKSSLVVTAVVFVVLSYVAPRLASAVPHLLTPAGRFNAMGIVAVALMCGGAHTLVSAYV